MAPVITYKNACDEICEEAEEWEPEVGGEEEITDFAGIITITTIIIMMIVKMAYQHIQSKSSSSSP